MPTRYQSGLTWLDANGRTALTIPRTSTSSSSPLQVALMAKSNAVINTYFTGQEIVIGGTPSLSDFASVLDRAQLYFQTAAGDTVTLTLPSPMLSIFKSDTFTVDPATIPAIISTALASLTDASGNPVTAFVTGLRQRRPGGP